MNLGEAIVWTMILVLNVTIGLSILTGLIRGALWCIKTVRGWWKHNYGVG